MISSALSGVARFIVFTDIVMDFIPVVSTCNNAVCLVSKIALAILNAVIPSAYQAIKDTRIVKHLDEKKAIFCVLLAIPVLNILFALGIHGGGGEGESEAPPRKKDPFEQQMQDLVDESERRSQEVIKQADKNREAFKKRMSDKRQADREEHLLKLQKLKEDSLQFPEGSERRKIADNMYLQWESLYASKESATDGLMTANGFN